MYLMLLLDPGAADPSSEVVNDLIRKAREKDRELEYIRTRLIASEKSVEKHGWVTETPNEMLGGFKERARRDGKLQNFPERKKG